MSSWLQSLWSGSSGGSPGGTASSKSPRATGTSPRNSPNDGSLILPTGADGNKPVGQQLPTGASQDNLGGATTVAAVSTPQPASSPTNQNPTANFVRTFFRFAWDQANDVEIRVVGSCPQLGDWQWQKGAILQTSFEYFPSWISKDPVYLPLGEKIEYQYVVIVRNNLGEQSQRGSSGNLLPSASSNSRLQISKASSSSRLDRENKQEQDNVVSVKWVTSPGTVRLPSSTGGGVVESTFNYANQNQQQSSSMDYKSGAGVQRNNNQKQLSKDSTITIDNGAKEGECLQLVPTGNEMTAEDDGGLFRKFSGKTAENLNTISGNTMTDTTLNYQQNSSSPEKGGQFGQGSDRELDLLDSRILELEEEGKWSSKGTVLFLTFLLPVQVVRTADDKWAVTPMKDHFLTSLKQARKQHKASKNKTGMMNHKSGQHQQQQNSSDDLQILCVGWPGVHVESEYDKRLISELLLAHDCIPVFPSPYDFENFVQFAFGLLSPIFHDVMQHMLFFDAKMTSFDEEQWASYQRVNFCYADVAIRHSHDSDYFWVHDYHLMVVPQYLTRKLRMANIGFFLHCPWPSFDIFKAIPVRDDLLRALLCADLIGFQFYDHARKFFVSTKRLLGLDWTFLPNGQLSLDYSGRTVCIKVSHVCISLTQVASAAERFRTAMNADRNELAAFAKTIRESNLDESNRSSSVPKSSGGGGGTTTTSIPNFADQTPLITQRSISEATGRNTPSSGGILNNQKTIAMSFNRKRSSYASSTSGFSSSNLDGTGGGTSGGNGSPQMKRVPLLFELEKQFAGKIIFAGLDRLESLSGMMLKVNAWKSFLSEHKQWRNKVILVQCAYPSEHRFRMGMNNKMRTSSTETENGVVLGGGSSGTENTHSGTTKEKEQTDIKSSPAKKFGEAASSGPGAATPNRQEQHQQAGSNTTTSPNNSKAASPGAEADVPSPQQQQTLSKSTLEQDLEGLVLEVNELFGQHIVLLLSSEEMEMEEKFALFQSAHVLINTTVKDGLNVNPLEFLACHASIGDQKAPMILSEFAGVSQILQGALIVNPWNTPEIVNAIVRCCRMSEEEKEYRFAKDLAYVAEKNPVTWLESFLTDLKASRKKDDKNYVAVGFGANFRILSMDSTFAKLMTDDVIHAYRNARGCRVFFLDNEGTLAPNFASRYARAKDHLRLKDVSELQSFGVAPSPNVLHCLNELMQDPRNIVVVISGRTRKQLSEWFSPVFNNIGLAAEHGFCYRIPSVLGDEWYQEQVESDMSWKNVAFELMREYTARTQGSWMENKGSALVWQYRDADPEFGDLQAKELGQHLREFLANSSVMSNAQTGTNQPGSSGQKILHSSGVENQFGLTDTGLTGGSMLHKVEVTNGKGYVECRVAGINKGAAVSKILQKISLIRGDPDFILCMGDDRSDEDMFEVVNQLSLAEGDDGGGSVMDGAKSTSESNLQFFAGGMRSIGGLQRGSRGSASSSRMNLLGGIQPVSNLGVNTFAGDGSDLKQQYNVNNIMSCTIGQKPSKAKYYLHDVEEVTELLEALKNSVRSCLEGDETKLQQVYKSTPAKLQGTSNSNAKYNNTPGGGARGGLYGAPPFQQGDNLNQQPEAGDVQRQGSKIKTPLDQLSFGGHQRGMRPQDRGPESEQSEDGGTSVVSSVSDHDYVVGSSFQQQGSSAGYRSGR
ncbi:unnamed protein product [Amoebophrya sp. A120]|nr:unnamed protein product [Amoebophrya sp. A120]|eukprot:GSA120T00024690001.1